MNSLNTETIMGMIRTAINHAQIAAEAVKKSDTVKAQKELKLNAALIEVAQKYLLLEM
jgi:hypothetical protein